MPRRMAARAAGAIVQAKEVPVHYWMNGWDWFWMSFMMLLWIVVLGAVVYVAVRLAQRRPSGPQT